MKNLLDAAVGENVFIDPEHAEEVRRRIHDANLPPLSVHVLLAEHGGDEADQPEIFEEQFAACDVWMPESAQWDELTLEHFRMVAEGKMTVDDFYKIHRLQESMHERHRFTSLFRSSKAVAIADMHFDHSLATENPISKGTKYAVLGSKNIPDLLRQLRKNIERDGRFHRARESLILLNMPDALHNAMDRYPALREKASLKILLTLGSYHRDIVNAAETVGLETTWSAENPDQLENIGSVLSLNRRMVRGEDVSDDDIVSAVLQEEFSKYAPYLDIPPSILAQEVNEDVHIANLTAMFDAREQQAMVWEVLVQNTGAHNRRYWQLIAEYLQEQIDAKIQVIG